MVEVQHDGEKEVPKLDPNSFKDSFELKVPGYRIVEQCGDGSTAKVYVAIQESLERRVALKVMVSASSVREQRATNFLKEGRVIAKLAHPNIVTIYDIGVASGHHYIAMEYLPWGSLRHRLNKKLELSWILMIVEQIASALAFAHENGFIHRDIKPENILFRNKNLAVLSDFGIAMVSKSQAYVTDLENFGTPRYMSPDQISLRSVGPSSDVYSLGIVLFEMLTGKPPYYKGDSLAIRHAQVHDPIPVLPQEYRHIQPLINKMLAKHPKNRIISAREVVNIISYLNKENRLPEDFSDWDSSSDSLSRPTAFSDKPSIKIGTVTDDSVQKQSSVSSESIISDPVADDSSNDVVISSTHQIDKHKPHSFTKQFIGFFAIFGKFLKGNITKFLEYFREPKELTELKPSSTEVRIGNVRTKRFIPLLKNPAILSVFLGVASLALFLVHMNESTIPPSHEPTQSPIQDLHDKYVSWSVYYLRKNEFKRAKYFIQKARVINPDDLVSQELAHSISQHQNIATLQPHINQDALDLMQSSQNSNVSVVDLLNNAELQLQNKNLTTPPFNNAFHTYQTVLKTEPDNADAIEGISIIKNKYIYWADHDLKKNNYRRAMIFYKKALAIDPTDAQLVERLEALKNS